MSFNYITSRDNAGVKLAVKLNSSAKQRRESGLFVLDGLRLCRDAVLNNYRLKTLYLTEAFYEAHKEDARLLMDNSSEVYFAAPGVMEKMSETVNPQGIIAVCEIPQKKEEMGNGFLVGVENLSDPSNLGAISRSAEAFGAEGLVLLGSCCDPYSPKSLRAGMGALLRLPIFSFPDIFSLREKCDGVGKEIFASVVDKTAENVILAPKNENSLLLIGNEANGISKATSDNSHRRVTIPMKGRAESLNAAAAAAVLIWEFTKN